MKSVVLFEFIKVYFNGGGKFGVWVINFYFEIVLKYYYFLLWW